MKIADVYSIYDAIITAEASGDFAAASAYSNELSKIENYETSF